MQCSVCEEEMIIIELHKIEVDYCVSCKGIWLDAGELGLLLDDYTGKYGIISKLKKEDAFKEASKNCPICSKEMDKIVCLNKEGKYTKNITIDKCINGHGLWFDKGELKELVENMELDEDNKILDFLNDMFFLND